MSKISAMMDIGKRSLMNSQTSLQTVSHNIANRSTEGFSRQKVHQQAALPVGQGKLQIGMGARPTSVERVNNPFLEKQLLNEGAEMSFHDSKSQAMSRVEEIYNEQLNKGLNKFMADFFNAFRELAGTPENLANRTLVKEAAKNLVNDFSRVSDQLKDVQKDINVQIKSQLEKVNRFSEEIANLNEKIQHVELSGAKANDERDRRDLLLKKLAEKINIRWAEGDSGMVTVTAGNAAILVAGHNSMTIEAQEVPDPGNREGLRTRLFYKQKPDLPAHDMTNQFDGGAIGAILSVRDETIEGLLDDMDQMAFEFANQVNRVHRKGFNRFGETEKNLFEVEGMNSFNAAKTIQVSEEVLADVGKIATAAIPNSAGDNRVANVIASLQYKGTVDGKATFDEFYNGIVGKVGVVADQSNVRLDSQKNVVKQLNNLRDSISGVSLDEETAKMIEFQKTFDASARLITTAEEMLDTVLSLKR